jgi:hypothetical protein
MEHSQILKSIQFIRPNSEFSLSGTELTWLDDNQVEPTNAEIEAGWIAYQAAQEVQAQANATAKAALLDRLGITAEEARLLLS